MRLEILGVRLKGRSPIAHVEVPLGPGLTVLAGLNGSGKTRVLQGVRAAILGERWEHGETQLIFRAVDGDSEATDLEVAVRSILHGRSTAPFRFRVDDSETLGEDSSIRFGDRTESLEGGAEFWRDHLLSALHSALLEEWEAAAMPLAQSAVLALVLRGDEIGLHVCIEPRPDDLTLRNALHETRALYAAHVQELYALEQVPDEDDVAGCFPPEVEMECPVLNEDVRVTHYLTLDNCADPYAGEVLPIPLVPIGSFSGSTSLDLYDVDDVATVLDDTKVRVSRTFVDDDTLIDFLVGQPTVLEAESRLLALVAGRREVAAARVDVARGPLVFQQRVGVVASDLLRALLVDAPRLSCFIAPVRDWLSGPPLTWMARDSRSGREVELQDLSAAERRWSLFAVGVANRIASSYSIARELPMVRGWLAVDEPELGIHRTAEQYLASGLRSVSETSGVHIVAASHSPAVMAAAHQLLVVGRDAVGDVSVRAVPDDVRERSTALGVTTVDMLAWYKAFLLVEGEHDRAVVEFLLEDLLLETRTLVVPIGGVKGSAATFTSEILIQFTSARIIVLVDGLGSEAGKTWAEARRLAGLGDAKGARRIIRAGFKENGAYEGRFLRSAGELLIESGDIARVDALALDVGDVIELLPASDFVAEATWSELRKGFSARRPGERAQSFKDWLRTHHGATISTDSIKRSAERLQVIPPELTPLRAALQAAPEPRGDRNDDS